MDADLEHSALHRAMSMVDTAMTLSTILPSFPFRHHKCVVEMVMANLFLYSVCVCN